MDVPKFHGDCPGSYLGQQLNTNAQGEVAFSLPEQSYKVRADYLGYQFWSDPFVWTDTAVTINHGLAVLHVTRGGADVVDAPVYLFKGSGSYLGKYERTDTDGIVEFLLPDQQYKFRVDYEGTQYWSDVVTIIPHEENNIELNLDLLALNLTNDPNPVRFDGVPPEVTPEKVMVASLYDLTGLLAQSVVSQIPGETAYYYINDHLGTPQKMIDENGAVVWSADYRPFGDADVDPVSTATNSFRFPGQYCDQETGLHYNYHRYYDPGIGRYLRTDPIGLEGGINPFIYADNRPTNLIDPQGLKWGWGFEGSLVLVGGSAFEYYDQCCKGGKVVKRTIAVQCISGGLILNYKIANLKLPGGGNVAGSRGGFGHCGEDSWTETTYWNVGGNLGVFGKDSQEGWHFTLGLGGYVKMFNHCSYTVTKEKPTGDCCND